MVRSLLRTATAVCLRNPPILLVRHCYPPHWSAQALICVRCMGEWLFEVSEVKEDSLNVALATFSMHVLQVTTVFFYECSPRSIMINAMVVVRSPHLYKFIRASHGNSRVATPCIEARVRT
jgi:hypothetical protein